MKFVKDIKYTFEIKTLSSIDDWEEDFEELRYQILTSNDPKKRNYSKRQFILRDQEEVAVLYKEQKIMAFSSLYHRDYYQKGLSRILNRMWKQPELRTIELPYHLVSKLMLDVLIQKAIKLQKEAVFISTEGIRHRWLQKWTQEAKKDNSRWFVLDGMYQVAPCEDLSCWQNVALLPLNKSYKLPFKKMSKEDWLKKRDT